MADDMRANLTKGSTWTRLIYIILFSITFKVAGFIIAIITLVQFVTALINGGTANNRLQEFGGTLALYLRQVVDYLTYASDEKPFPIGPWPTDETAFHNAPSPQSTPQGTPKSAKSTAKTSAPKSAPKKPGKRVTKVNPKKS